MSTFLMWALGLIIFLTVIAISIGLHEAGHMFTAKALKIHVPQFFVGFGPTLWSFKKKGTEYGVKAIPLGGFIQVEDTSQPEGSEERILLSYISPWKRFLVFIAGPAVNLALGFIILFSLLITTPQNILSRNIETVNDCNSQPTNCAAYKAGLKPGDVISKIDGESGIDMVFFNESLNKSGSTIEVIRNGRPIDLKVVPNSDTKKIGISLKTESKTRTPSEAVALIGNFFNMNLHALARIPEQVPHVAKAVLGVEKRSDDSMSSIIGVGKVYGETVSEKNINTDDKFHSIILYTALLNLGLGFVNLLPLLPLDGGRIFIAFIDQVKILLSKVRRKRYSPLNSRWVENITIVTGTLVFGFSLLLIVADIVAPISR